MALCLECFTTCYTSIVCLRRIHDESLILKDTSKYGTFVNGERLTAPVNIKSGDEVTFGVFHSKFSVAHQKPMVCSSCLDNEGKTSLSQALQALGGSLVNTWTEDCTHLVMPSIKVTIKTISALLCCRPIVKPEFFSELNNAVQQKLPPPKAESFTPEIDEPSLNKEDVNLGVIPLRKRLFTGKTFVFLSAKQLKRLSAAVKFGGGRSQLLEEGSLLRNLLESPQSCVVDVTTGSSQALLPPSSAEWANSVRSIVQRKGLRVITESEIGLAAIYASCDMYCNSSSLMPDSDSAPKVNPRIPSASLSQSATVDESVLPAASQNITAYAANTETSQRVKVCEVSGVAAVGETPEKQQNQNSDRFRGSKLAAQNTTTSQCVVAETMSSSFNTTENSQRKKPESRLTAAGDPDVRPQPSVPKTNGGTKASFFRPSPQKPKTSAQASPQKQSTLINFFQPVSKKRPLEDDFLSDVMSEPKRPVLEPPATFQKPNTATEIPSLPLRGVSETPPESESDLFTSRPDERQNRKRKEMEEEIQMEELESIMSEGMDCFDEQLSDDQTHSSAKQKQGLSTEEASSKRQRLQRKENETTKRQSGQVGLEKTSSLHHNQGSEQHVVTVKTEPVDPTDYRTTTEEFRKPAEKPTARKNIKPFEDDDVEDLELLGADISLPTEDTKTPLKPVKIKQEPQETKMDESLPQKLVMVEFRSLTVSAPPTTKQKQTPANVCAKNFKCFRKNRVPGADGFQHVIGGSDLLVHNKGKNTDLDEWLKDAAEEERQSRREEAAGDDLFRYNPTKLAKRR
ncbi:nibrin [Stegastes partitus]|uniref:Nibrin n=2 Tax=Stegastes partitus TaxID=144197 RepID=A0A9Y4K3L7_9TELE|nr:PREDICTED: nibrin [Stegastes partitus]